MGANQGKSHPIGGKKVTALYKPWAARKSLFGDIVVVTFFCVQCLDGVLTYFGIRTWGPAIEANPLVSSAVAYAGLGVGLAGTKLFAVALGMVLHLNRIHTLVALLTAFYVAAAILPWMILLLR